MPNTVSASIPIKVQRQNYYATLAIDVTNSLSQSVDAATGDVTPNWETTTSLQPRLTPVINCPIGYMLSSLTWERDGNVIATLSGTVDSTMYTVNPSTGALTIRKNLASLSNTDPDTFTCRATIIVNNISYNLSRSVSATIVPASADGYAVIINASPGTALDSDRTSCTLTAVVYKGSDEIQSGLTYKWYKGGMQVGANASLSVSRSDVDWEQLYRVEVYDSNSNLQCVGSIVVTDQADNYALAANISGDVTDTQAATISIQLQQRRTSDSEWSNAGIQASYTAVLYDVADTDKVQVATGTLDSTGKASFTVSAATMAGANNGSGIDAGYIDIVASW